MPANNPANTRHGGVGLFYKSSLPVIVRNDLSFNESVVVELKFGRKKVLFYIEVQHLIIILLIFKHSCPILKICMLKLKLKTLLQYFFTGDFNAHSQFWWPDGDTTPEGTEIENLITSLGLTPVISELTNFEPNKNPSCIDLVITDQPSLILDSGTRASLDPYCHHQIIYCKVNFRIPRPSQREKKIGILIEQMQLPLIEV